jgi:hypothetical protein
MSKRPGIAPEASDREAPIWQQRQIRQPNQWCKSDAWTFGLLEQDIAKFGAWAASRLAQAPLARHALPCRQTHRGAMPTSDFLVADVPFRQAVRLACNSRHGSSRT